MLNPIIMRSEEVMEIKEGIAKMVRLFKDKCIFCGKDHPEPKKDKIKPTGWKRAEIVGVGGNFSAKKNDLYPDGKSPPTVYSSEGHHCLAFSSFIVDARKSPKDRFPKLNHYIKEKGYDPNNKNNTIDLPGRKQKDDAGWQTQSKKFGAFEKAVLAKKPLQLHIGGHCKKLMNASNLMLLDIVNGIQDSEMCAEPKDTFKQELYEQVVEAEDNAFKLTAAAESPWILHPEKLVEAERYVCDKHHDILEIKYPKI